MNGLGEETVDSIMLYACNIPVFVVDAYTKRIFSRYGVFEETPTYREAQDFFMSNLPHDAGLFNDYHAQIVHLGNTVCRPRPNCAICPLKELSQGPGCASLRQNIKHV